MTDAHIDKVVAYYDEHASENAVRFLSHSLEEALGALLCDLPAAPADILDVGAGPGRDALFLMQKGYRVVALEPAAALRSIGMAHTAGSSIVWHDDRLPHLAQITGQFDFILLSAVWMFLPPDQRLPALQRLAQLLKPGGKIGMTVQSAFGARQELKFATSEAEFAALAAQTGLKLLACRPTPDSKGRHDVAWQTVVFQNQM